MHTRGTREAAVDALLLRLIGTFALQRPSARRRILSGSSSDDDMPISQVFSQKVAASEAASQPSQRDPSASNGPDSAPHSSAADAATSDAPEQVITTHAVTDAAQCATGPASDAQ